MVKFEQDIGDEPSLADRALVDFRMDLIREEVTELGDALRDDDIVEFADAIADTLYVVLGTALALGIPLDRVWDEVHRSNMAKVGGKNSAGKVMKGPNWTPPDVKGALGL